MANNVSTSDFETLLYSCADLKSTWLLVHVLYTCLLSFYLSIFIITLYLNCVLLWLFYRSYRHLNETFIPDDGGIVERIIRRYRLTVIKWETATAFTYLLLTLTWTWLFDIGQITSMRLTRWIIEAFLLPWASICVILENYVGRMSDGLTQEDALMQMPLLLLVKFIQLVSMRYAELVPSSQLNDFQTNIFYRFCPVSTGHQIPEGHPIRPFVKSVQRL